MTITLGSNIAAISAQRQLAKKTDDISVQFERLSSGLRINRASDDAAGLSIASSLDANSRIYTQGIRNVNDGVSFLNIADSALESLSTIAIRVAELSEQSANGSYGAAQRQALDAEAQALSAEYTRIIQTSKFNGINVFRSSGNTLTLQAGFGTAESTSLSIGASLYHQVGDGTFGAFNNLAALTTQGAGSAPNLKTGDMNRDGYVDLVVGNHTGGGYWDVKIQFGNGDGTFKAPVTVTGSSGQNAADVRVVDIDNDNDLDVLLGAQAGVSVSINNGSGTFSTGTGAAGAIGSLNGDFTGDGKVDLMVLGAAAVYIGVGNGDGSFNASTSIPMGVFTDGVVGDFNGDSRQDLLLYGGTSVSLWTGNGNGTFNAGVTLGTSISSGTTLSKYDIDGDGDQDWAIASGSSVFVGIGNGNGTFNAPRSFVIGSGVLIAGFTDNNDDGSVDIVAASSTSVATIFGNGDGTFKASISSSNPTNSASSSAIADLNSDGVSDVITMGPGGVGIQIANSSAAIDSFDIDLTTQAAARTSLDSSRARIESLARERGQIGAYLSRLQVNQNNLASFVTSIRAAHSRIMEADVGSESSKLLSSQISQQASSAVLAQANQIPALALSLLS